MVNKEFLNQKKFFYCYFDQLKLFLDFVIKFCKRVRVGARVFVYGTRKCVCSSYINNKIQFYNTACAPFTTLYISALHNYGLVNFYVGNKNYETFQQIPIFDIIFSVDMILCQTEIISGSLSSCSYSSIEDIFPVNL